MKTILKNTIAAIAISVSFVACQGSGHSDADSVSTDSSTFTTVTDTVKKDTNSMVPDSLKQDTAVKTTKTQTKIKTTEIHN